MNQLEISKFPTLEYAANEAFNTLSTSLFYCGTDIKTILITSRYAVEGKSFVSMNLMRTLASLNKRVVLLDTDLRRSGIVGRFRIRFDTSAPMGLAQYLAGMCQMKDILYGTNIPNAYMIPIGREVSSSLQLLSSERMPELMEQRSGRKQQHDDNMLLPRLCQQLIPRSRRRDLGENRRGEQLDKADMHGHRSVLRRPRFPAQRQLLPVTAT